jgi:hypothetical protein
MLRWLSRSANGPCVPAIEANAPGKDTLATDAAIFDRIAAEVVRRGMVTPAVLFIELNRPLAFLAGQTAHVLFPFLAPLLGIGLARQLAHLLEDPANVDRLLERVEQLAMKELA